MGQVRVGTASWTDRTLLESGWYPPEADTPEKRLRYYARQFSLVEVDATYYALPAEQTATAWAARTPAAFTFNVKAFSLFTHHPTPVAALPTDLRPAAEKTGKDRVYFKDVGPALADQVWERFLAALDPLRAERKLGAILLQFPPWFPISRARKDYIVACAERAAPDRVCVEFRNRTWMTPDNQEETLGFLAEHRLPYVCVDMPQGHRDSIPPVLAATSPDLAVVRLHGHSDRWDSKDIHERFGYRYTDRELQEWAPKVRALARDPEQTHVLFNNCYRNYAQVNAQRLAELVSTEEGTALLGVQSQCGRRHRRGALPPLADLAGPKAQAPFGDTTYCPSRDSRFQAGSSGGPPLPVTSLRRTRPHPFRARLHHMKFAEITSLVGCDRFWGHARGHASQSTAPACLGRLGALEFLEFLGPPMHISCQTPRSGSGPHVWALPLRRTVPKGHAK